MHSYKLMSLVYELSRRAQCQPVNEWSSSIEGLHPKVKEEYLFSLPTYCVSPNKGIFKGGPDYSEGSHSPDGGSLSLSLVNI